MSSAVAGVQTSRLIAYTPKTLHIGSCLLRPSCSKAHQPRAGCATHSERVHPMHRSSALLDANGIGARGVNMVTHHIAQPFINPLSRVPSAGRARSLLLLAAWLVVLAVVPPAKVVAYDFTARGTWTSKDGRLNGTWEANFDAAGQDLSGTLVMRGLRGISQGMVAGSRSPGGTSFAVMFTDRELLTFSGAVSGLRCEGTFETPEGVSGRWTGSLVPAARTPAARATPRPEVRRADKVKPAVTSTARTRPRRLEDEARRRQ